MDNVYNRSLFQARSRDARNKLARMGGIMSSSQELMEAAQPRTAPPPMSMAMPMTQPMQVPVQAPVQVPVPVQMAQPAMQPAMQSLPMGQPMAQPVAQAQAAPVQQAPQRPPIRMAEGGAVDISESPIDFVAGLRSAAKKMNEALGPDAVNMSIFDKKVENIAAAASSKDPERVKAAVTEAVDVPNTKDGLEDAAVALTSLPKQQAQNLSIDELNDRIMAVALNGSLAAPGSMAERYAKAMLFGLGQKRETAMARAAAKTGGSGISPLEPYADAVRDLAGKLVQEQGLDLAEAIAQAEAALRPLYSGNAGAPKGGVDAPTSGGEEPTVEMHVAANAQAKQAGQKTYVLNGIEYNVQ